VSLDSIPLRDVAFLSLVEPEWEVFVYVSVVDIAVEIETPLTFSDPLIIVANI
jgi:hypothetical protein